MKFNGTARTIEGGMHNPAPSARNRPRSKPVPSNELRLLRPAFHFGFASLIIAFWLLLVACPIFTLTARAQMIPKSNSPLYSPLPPLNSGTANGLPNALKDIGIDQKLDSQVPLDIELRDEEGQSVQLGKYFGGKPVVLSLVYYACPMLCTQVLSGMTETFNRMSFNVGEQFEVVTVSFDPRELPELAAAKKEAYLRAYNRPGGAEGWHFLTGDSGSIRRLTDAVGFRYKFDVATNQFAHASGIMLLTPGGKVARYFYGIDYSPKDLRLGLVEASAGKIGSPVDQLLLYCYHYDPATGKYGAVVMNIIRVGGIVTLLAMGLMFLLLRRRVRRVRPVPGPIDLDLGGAA